MQNSVRIFVAAALTLMSATSSWGHGKDGEPHPEVKFQIPPIMPPNAWVSGYCCLLIDVTKEGKPDNIQTIMCSEPYYEKPSTSAVSQWIYTPYQDKDGKVTRFNNHKVTTYFMLQNQYGVMLSNRNGFGAKTEDGFNRDAPCYDFIV